MLASSARRPHRSRSGALRAAAAGTLSLGLLLTGCAQEKKVAPEPTPTPIANLNTAAMEVPRIEFCGLVPDEAISEALGSKPEADAAYKNGDEEELPDIGTDVVHEIGCSWTGEDGSAARAWVFARPISATFAETVVASSMKPRGCRTVPGAAYGKPTMTQVCQFVGDEHRVRHAGLFGQTWLTCELTASAVAIAELRTRTDRWCVEVANALNTAR